MRSSPRRPLILKRRKLNLSQKDGARSTGTPEQRPPPVTRAPEPHGQSLAVKPGVPATPGPSLPSRVVAPSPQELNFSESIIFPDESQTSSLEIPESCVPQSAEMAANTIKVMGHPTIPDTQLVVIPQNADVESIIQALTARGREGGGPNKFILISGGPSFHTQAEKLGFQSKEEEVMTVQIEAPSAAQLTEEDSEEVVKAEGEDLNISLTNMQWLGKMATDGLSTCDMLAEPAEEETPTPQEDSVKAEKEPEGPPPTLQWPSSISERPPYSYMALIQFAINSTPTKRMTLKDIYTWIEDHFPYFKYVAKPGWKNSIRHNLSLHDMFVRESLSNNKISYWTIHPQANRCLTLDQVYKAGGSAASAPSEPKLPIPDLSKRMNTSISKAPERRMKPLLPRIESYFVPVQFPVTQPVLFSPVEAFCSDPASSDGTPSTKRVKIAPKILMEAEETPPAQQPMEIKVEPEPAKIKTSTPFLSRRSSGSRRKQQLPTPSFQEPELVLPECSAADSGLDTDFSFLQDTNAQEGPSQITQDEDCTFKTPIKERLKPPPSSSTPSKPPEAATLPPWNFESPLTRNLLPDLSPVRIPCSTALTPFKDSYGALNFGETPFKDIPFFGSPTDLIGTLSPPSPQSDTLDTPKGVRKPKRCSKELQVGGTSNRSLLEGFVLDTKDESLSKILLDISFSGMEEDNFVGADSSYLAQLLSELR